ncbi:MAG: OmpH family outer membrane protein [Bacteroidales bacterium]|nr:OmpH family outer membrane protein [Bacteroidales bacterium]MBP5635689.1 OmpH family outer membrane protein [Bacteroidales bacterium]
MKRISTILGLAAIAMMAVSCNQAAPAASAETAEPVAHKGAVVYFNLDTVIKEYDMANDLSSVVETKVQGINQEVTRRQNRLQSDVNSFQEKVNKGLLTSSVAEAQYQKLQQQDQEFQQYAAQKQQEIYEEQTVMQNQIADAIKTFIDAFNAEKQYAMIIATQGDILPLPVVAGDADLDITEEIVAGLNAEYIKTKDKK